MEEFDNLSKNIFKAIKQRKHTEVQTDHSYEDIKYDNIGNISKLSEKKLKENHIIAKKVIKKIEEAELSPAINN